MGMKKLAALVMALVLCMTAAGAMAGVSTDAELEAAIADIQANGGTGTIELENSIEGHGIIIPSGMNLTIDFKNFTYTTTGAPLAGSSGTENQAFQILKNSKITLKNGTIKTEPNIGVRMLIQNYANLTLENMVLDGENVSSPKYVLSNNNCTTNITGNTSIKAPDGGVAFDVYDYCSGYSGKANVIVNTTGTIKGKIEVDGEKEDSTNPAPLLVIANVGSGSDLEIVVSKKGEADLNNLPVGTSIENKGDGMVTANGIALTKGDSIVIPATYVEVELPKTGDNSSLLMWTSLLALAAAGFVVSRRTRLN